MIENINQKGFEYSSTPSVNVIKFLEKFLESSKPISVAEIGVGTGATAVEIVKRLRNSDSYYFFSYENDVNELENDLRNLDYCTCTLYPMGNSHKIYDSYNWNLSSLCLENQMLFDLVYLDGAHTFYHDALATVLLKRLIKPNGILIFDDVDWTFEKSPSCNPEIRPQTLYEFTHEQIITPHVQKILDIFMETDNNWERIGDIAHQTVYKKIR